MWSSVTLPNWRNGGQIFSRFRIGERDLLNVNFKMEFQGKHGEDNEFYRKWADLFGFYNLCLVFMIKCLQLQLRLRLASHWIIRKKGILGGIVKGFKGGKVNNTMDLAANSKLNFGQLEAIFSRNPFLEHVATTTDDQKTMLELNIDDIHIDDEPVSAPSTSAHKVQRKRGTEREKLFDGEVADAKPRLRTREEIIATYRKAGDASSVTGQARDKLVERQEKLEVQHFLGQCAQHLEKGETY